MKIFTTERENWELVREEERYGDPHLQVLKTEMRTPTRPGGCTWTVVHRKAAVVVAPMTAGGDLVLIRQERVPVRETLWECPAGQVDEAGEPGVAGLQKTALRELREETGWELGPGGELASLGYFFSSAGFTDEHAYLFLARPVVLGAGGASPDEHEAILECRGFSPGEVRGMIAANEIRDANTLAVYARLTAMGYFS
jgi:8-oxo-dGTP pyrophosphatase MutT (NUDIX family)